ncbi:MAG: hypothetical protein J6M22_03865 [Firmicutes bacterium]|nr:hypothetical protein [Bacillota bacterium]
MKMKSKVLVVLLALVLVFSMTACGGDDAESTWGDRYAAVLDSGEARDHADYQALADELIQIRDECGATYVYVMTPADADGNPSADGDYSKDGTFLLTAEGSEDPDDWATDYGWEIQFTEAWEGTPAAARSAWSEDDEGTTGCWSAFAPIYDSEGTVVAILGIDYPADDIIVNYPEWDRYNDNWNGYEEEITGEVPADVADMISYTTAVANKYAQTLSGQEAWADQYVALLESGEARDYADYESIMTVLSDMREDIGATYIYTLTPAGEDGETPDYTAEYNENDFLITVDGCEEPDDWGVAYEWEIQFTEAWEGTPSSARSAWDNYGDGYCWSAFAPIYDSEGTVVAILGIDYPCDDVVAANPEWNRDGDVFNGFHDEITGEVPADVAAMRDTVTNYAKDLARLLSGTIK